MADEWFYSQNGQSLGPVSVDTLRSMIASGTLGSQEMVWRNGMANWSPAGMVPELGMVAPAQQMPPPSMYAQPSPYPQPGVAPVGYYAPPTAYGTVAYAGFWLRFVAMVIDSLILMVAGVVVGFIIGFLIGIAMSGQPRDQIVETAQGLRTSCLS